MIMFAILYFSLMVERGCSTRSSRLVLSRPKGDPAKIAVGTAALTLLVALDGDGASTFLITVSALLPLYKRVGMSPLVLAATVGLAAGVMNMSRGAVRPYGRWPRWTSRARRLPPRPPGHDRRHRRALLASFLIGRKERPSRHPAWPAASKLGGSTPRSVARGRPADARLGPSSTPS